MIYQRYHFLYQYKQETRSISSESQPKKVVVVVVIIIGHKKTTLKFDQNWVDNR